jgi:uncharacterized protein (TIGR03086 family)
MSEVSQRYAAIANGFTRRLEGTSAEQWLAPTPCTEWTAGDLVGHVIATHRRVIAVLDDAEPLAVGPDDDLPVEWRRASTGVIEALQDPERATKIVGGIFRDQPFELLVGQLVCADTLIHTWDLARATGQDEELDPDGTGKAMEFLTTIDAQMRGPGRFAAKIDPGPDADEQARLLNFSGRAV